MQLQKPGLTRANTGADAGTRTRNRPITRRAVPVTTSQVDRPGPLVRPGSAPRARKLDP